MQKRISRNSAYTYFVTGIFPRFLFVVTYIYIPKLPVPPICHLSGHVKAQVISNIDILYAIKMVVVCANVGRALLQ